MSWRATLPYRHIELRVGILRSFFSLRKYTVESLRKPEVISSVVRKARTEWVISIFHCIRSVKPHKTPETERSALVIYSAYQLSLSTPPYWTAISANEELTFSEQSLTSFGPLKNLATLEQSAQLLRSRNAVLFWWSSELSALLAAYRPYLNYCLQTSQTRVFYTSQYPEFCSLTLLLEGGVRSGCLLSVSRLLLNVWGVISAVACCSCRL